MKKEKKEEKYIYIRKHHNVWVSNVSACMGGGLAQTRQPLRISCKLYGILRFLRAYGRRTKILRV